MNKEVRQFLKKVQKEQPGWVLQKQRLGSGHLRLDYILGGFVTLSHTPTDHRWLQNVKTTMRAMEEKYGKYIPPVKEKKERGMNYTPPIPLPDFPSKKTIAATLLNKPEIILPKLPEQPIINNVIKSQTKEKYVMNTQDKEIIIKLLQEKYDSLKAILEPHLPMIQEYQQVEKTLTGLKSSLLPEEQKIAEFLEKKKEQIRAIPVKGKRQELYTEVEKFLKEKQSKVDISTVLDWVVNEKKLNFCIKGTTPRVSLIQHIRELNKANFKNTLIIGPEKTEGQIRPSYHYIEYKAPLNGASMINHY